MIHLQLKTMKENQKLAEEVKQSEIEITYDLAIAKVTMLISSSEIFFDINSFEILSHYL